MKARKIYYVFVFALLIVGCQKNNTSNIGGDNSFKFVPYLQEDGEIKPISSITKGIAGDLSSTGFKLVGVLTNSAYSTSTTGQMLDKKIFWGTQTTVDGKYENEIRNWVTDGKTFHTFYAYSSNPTTTTEGCGGSALSGMESDTPQPSITFKQENDPAKQIDLLTTEAIMNIKTDNNVPVLNLYFRHRLSRVTINLFCSGGATLVECQPTITYGSGGNKVVKTASINLAPNTAIVPKSEFHEGTVIPCKNFTLPASANSADNSMRICDLILIPQVVELGYITLDITYKLSSADINVRYARVNFEPITLACEKQYNYYLNLHEENTSLTVSAVTVNSWRQESAMVDELK